jgi:RNA recognition motif-containing protein
MGAKVVQNELYVGNIGHSTTEPELTEAFAPYGDVQSVSIMTDRYTDRPRGFAFVEMGSEAEAQAAIDSMNGRDVGGLSLTVNIARTHMPRVSAGDDGHRQVW